MRHFHRQNVQTDIIESQRSWVFAVLMAVGGFYGAYTYTIRGGVFCNAQTANFVLFAMALGSAHWSRALYYLIPMSAYFLGAFLSEAALTSPRQKSRVRWETWLIGVEMLVVLVLGFLPDSLPCQISQVAVNFICSMQYNTFRVAEGVPMATTFCTNHLRQTGAACCRALRTRERKELRRAGRHLLMLLAFVLGATISTVLCLNLGGRAIWAALLPLGILLFDLLRADLAEKASEAA